MRQSILISRFVVIVAAARADTIEMKRRIVVRYPRMSSDTIWIGNDHGGYELKAELLKWLAEREIPCHDVGCHSTEIVRYPYYAARVAEAVLRGEAGRGILICSTGIGMSIIANRYREFAPRSVPAATWAA